MLRLPVALLSLFACLPLAAQDADAQKKFAGTWEAKVKDKVICTIRVKPGQPILVEAAGCTINVDEKGDLREPDTSEPTGEPLQMSNAKLQGDTMTFEDRDNGDVIRFEMKLTGEGQAELKVLDSPVPMKPVRFTRK